MTEGEADGLADGSGVGIKVRPDPDLDRKLPYERELPPFPIISRRSVACPMLSG